MVVRTVASETLQLTSHSLADTLSIGMDLGRAALAGDFISLAGDLGAGKSRLAEGIARGLGVAESVAIPSPTFTIVNEHQARVLLVHADFYRLSSAAELEAIGWRDYESRDPVIVVEWLSHVEDHVAPEDRLDIRIETRSESERTITLRAFRPRGLRLLAACRRAG